MDKILLDFSFEELENLIKEIGEPKYRAGQIFRGLYQYKKFEEMTDISKSLREKLAENYVDCPIEIVKTLVSKDGTIKFLFKLQDGNVIESVVMKYKHGNTICVSTQVGCRMNCSFCASGLDGLVRNLTSG